MNPEEEECPATMRGRHDSELKCLKEGQHKMDTSIRELTIAIKEYVVLTQESQSKRIDEQERLQKRQDSAIEKQTVIIDRLEITISDLTKVVVSTKGKTDFVYKVIIWSAAVLLTGTLGTMFTLIWNNATHIQQIEKVTSCLTYFIS